MSKNHNDVNSGKGLINRRKALKSISGAVATSSIAFSGITAGQEDENNQVRVNRNKEQPTDEEISNVVNSDIFSDFIKSMRIPKYDKSSAEVIEVTINNSVLSKTITVPTKYGTVYTRLMNGDPVSIIFKTDPTEIPKGLRKQYSGSAGWDRSQSAFVTAKGIDQPLVFTRETNSDEATSINEEVRSLGRKSDPDQTLVATTTDNSKGVDKLKLKSNAEIWAVYNDVTYRFDYETLELLEKSDTNGLYKGFESGSTGGLTTLGPTCSEQAFVCGADLVLSVPNCAIAASGCALSTIAAGGCLLIVIAICAPGALVGLAGCYQWCNNCADC